MERPMRLPIVPPGESPNWANVLSARVDAGLTQRDASARVGVGVRTWRRWEANKTKMPPDKWTLFLRLVAQKQH